MKTGYLDIDGYRAVITYDDGLDQLRGDREVREAATLAATRSGVSLNTWTVEALKRAAAEILT